MGRNSKSLRHDRNVIMKTETKTIYKCEYCNKLYQMKHYCLKHEERCTRNPENHRPCYLCEHLSMERLKVIYVDYRHGYEEQVEHEANALFCNKKQTGVYQPKNEQKDNMYTLSDFENEPMPRECELFE